MTDVVEIPFGEWLPSAPTYKSPGCVVADNVIPTAGDSYGPHPSLASFAAESLSDEDGFGLLDESNVPLDPEVNDNSVSGAGKGARQIFDNSGESVIVGGTNTSLFVRRTTIVETTGLSALGAGDAWDFCQYNDFVFATGANNSPQYLSDVDTDNAWSAAPGSPPNAKRCARVGEFVMMGNISGAPTRVQWSAFNNPTGSWAQSRLTQASFVDFPVDGGEVQRIIGGRYAMVFQKRALSRLTYVGPPTVWQKTEITTERGATAPFAVVQVGFLTYFLAQDGFYVTNGSQVQPIGNNRVNRWFFDTVDQNLIGEVHGAVDWQNERIVWVFSSGGVSYDRAISFSWGQNRWASATFSVDWLVGSQIDAVNLDSLDAIYGNLDVIPVSLDSAEFRAGKRILAAFQDGKYGTFSGTPLEAVWETGSTEVSPHQRVFISEVMPQIDCARRDEKILLKVWDETNAETQTQEKVVGWSGFAAVRAEGLKQSVRVTKPSTSWQHAQGVQVRFRKAGYR